MKEIKKEITGKEYWRSLDQLADTPEFKEFLHREFPENASEMTNPLTRRKFLSIMSASIALAGLTSCRKPVEKIVPYVKAPEALVPGNAQFYATTVNYGAHAHGLLVESHEGRPTKIEGNDKHPTSHGRTNAIMQAETLNLYDPDRAQDVTENGNRRRWNDFVTFWQEQYSTFAENGGEGLAIVSGEFSSPTLYRLYQAFQKTFPNAFWVVDEPVSQKNKYDGLRAATGQTLRALHHYDKARVVLSIDADFMGVEPEAVDASWTFASRRRVASEKEDMNRLYVVESSYSITGGMADHRKRMNQDQLEAFTRVLAAELGISGANADLAQTGIDQKWFAALVKDLKGASGNSIVVAGYRQSAATHALVFAINEILKNNNKTISYFAPDNAVLQQGDMNELVNALQGGSVKTLVALDRNLAYDTPANLNMADALSKAETFISFSSHRDETGMLAGWHVPQAHFIESWGDAAGVQGHLSVVQPVIEPLFGSKSIFEFLNLLTTGKDVRGYEIVRQTWTDRGISKSAWERTLHDGLAANTQRKPASTSLNMSAVASLVNATNYSTGQRSAESLQIIFRPSYSVHDGRFSNNGWLQEMPDPVTKICWDNAALISPRTAEELGLQSRDVVVLNAGGKELRTVVSVLPGQADYVISLEMGYGRKNLGRIADDVGFNVFALKDSRTPHYMNGVTLRKTGETYVLANTQDHNSMEGRPLVREATLEEYRENPNFAKEMVQHPPLRSLWTEFDYSKGYQWGMVIDLNTCSGCNACVIACQSENNIPIIGKEQVEKGREMHWIRLDRYFAGDIEEPEMVYQPMACQHCENAPCEQVCPVQATLHDEEGLNVMTYNRCIGTRYCSNNCPYKVRRFNFFNYTNSYGEMQKMAQNPDVTVRFRGVMEKCTYCTQRLQKAKIKARNEGRRVEDGDVLSACQQACPTDSIVFGNINDPESRVSQLKKQNKDYAVLAELNVKPRTTYLAKLRNPNPEIEQISNS